MLEEGDPYQPDSEEDMEDTKIVTTNEEEALEGLVYENRIRDRYHNLQYASNSQDRWQNNNNNDNNDMRHSSYDIPVRWQSRPNKVSSRPNIVSSRPSTPSRPFRRRYGHWYPMEEDNKDRVRFYYYGDNNGSNMRRGPSHNGNRRYGWRQNMVRKVSNQEEEEKRFGFVSLMEAGRRQRMDATQ